MGLNILSWNVLGISSKDLDNFCRDLGREVHWDALLLQEFCFTGEDFETTSDGHLIFAQTAFAMLQQRKDNVHDTIPAQSAQEGSGPHNSILYNRLGQLAVVPTDPVIDLMRWHAQVPSTPTDTAPQGGENYADAIVRARFPLEQKW